MLPVTAKHILSLDEARKHLQTADHLTYITFPLIKENRLLLKILEEINLSLLNTINSILQYEYIYKRIQLYNNANDNLSTFKSIAVRYNIGQEQLAKIINIMTIAEKHKKSPFEFVRNDKIVIMSDNMIPATITLENIKSYIIETKDLLRKVSLLIRKS